MLILVHAKAANEIRKGCKDIYSDKVIIEVKSIEALAPVHFAQTLTYLRLSGMKLGLFINFNSKLLKDSIRRVVNKL
ncbi:MAG: GxxExxY protein [Bacteroidetes bacterium]|nr:GxxExxY protein [Bacteroidota bacterium]